MPSGSGGDTTTKMEPWGPAAEKLEAVLPYAKDMFQSGGFSANPYGGPRVAGFGGASKAGQDMIMDTARGGVPGLGAARGAMTDLMRGNGVDIDRAQLPGMRQLEGMMSGKQIYRDLDAVKQNALGSAVPAAASMFSGSGMIGSTPAMDTVGRAATEAIAPIEYGAWNEAQNRRLSAIGQGQDARLAQQGLFQQGELASQGLSQQGQLGAAAMLPQLSALGYLPGQMMQGVGAQRDAMGQSRIDANMARYYEGQNQDQQNLTNYVNLLLGAGGQGSTGTQSGGGPGALGQMAGAGLGGLGAYGALAMNPATAPFALAGGGLAGLMGLLS